MRVYYNILEREKGWKHMAEVPDEYVISMPCKIVAFVHDKSFYTKFPQFATTSLIIMEWKYYMNAWSKYLPEEFTKN